MALVLYGDGVNGCQKHLGAWRSDCPDCKANVEEKPFGSAGDDNICDQCDSTGEVDGRVCTNCGGKGYLNP
jgi:DnaJ-class molecular chaperone